MRENGRNERLKSGADAQPCLSDVYKNGTRAKRRQADAALCGRSMVEMLGVLAIIGVLSVGAMNGYSKAMLKYKLNKQAEQISTLVYNLQQLYVNHEFDADNTSSAYTYLIHTLAKLNLLPSNNTDGNCMIDAMDNYICPYWIREDNAYGDGFFRLTIDHNNNKIANASVDIDSCRNILYLAKEMHTILWQVSSNTGNGSGGVQTSLTYFGDVYCDNRSKPCLRDFTISSINDICTNLKDTRSWINFQWF